LYTKAALLCSSVGLFPLAGVVAGTIIASARPEYSEWTYLLSTGPTAVLNVAYVALMSFCFICLNKQSSRSKRARNAILIGIIYKSIWIMFFIAHAASYTQVLSITSPAAWIFLMCGEICFAGLSMTELTATISKEQFTSKGLQQLKPQIVVTMDQHTTEGATVELADAHKSSTVSSDEACAGGICKPITKVDLKVAREMARPIWQDPPKSFSELFTFPHPVNEVEARIHAILACVYGSVILILGAVRPDVNAWWLYAWLIFGFLARALAGPKFDPQAWLVVLFIAPWLRIKPVYVPGPPKRFAQFCGLCCSVASLVLYEIHNEVTRKIGLWLMGMLVVLTIAQALHSVCVGCFFWHLIVLSGVLGPEILVKSTAEFQLRKPGESFSIHSKSRKTSEETSNLRESKIDNTKTTQDPDPSYCQGGQ